MYYVCIVCVCGKCIWSMWRHLHGTGGLYVCLCQHMEDVLCQVCVRVCPHSGQAFSVLLDPFDTETGIV